MYYPLCHLNLRLVTRVLNEYFLEISEIIAIKKSDWTNLWYWNPTEICESPSLNILHVQVMVYFCASCVGDRPSKTKVTLNFSHASHWVISILNTRLSLWAQDMLCAWYGISEPLRCSAKRVLFFPRWEEVTSARSLLFGANTPLGRLGGFIWNWKTTQKRCLGVQHWRIDRRRTPKA